MSNFENAIGIVLANEWGYKSPAAAARDGDPGGETFCGIARNYFSSWPGWKRIDKTKGNPSARHFRISLSDEMR